MKQQAEVAQSVALQPPIADFARDRKRGFMVQSCAVHDPHLAVFDTQVAKNIAFAMPVARLARQCQRRVVTLKSLLSPAQNGLYVTEQVVGVALNARIFEF